MSLRYALLAILRIGPLSGYELQKQFGQSVGHVWHAPDSQIYPELRKMEQAGLIEGEEQLRGERGTRRIYHVTPEGDADFAAWMTTPLDYQQVRDPAHLRAAYLESASPADACAFFRAHIAQWEKTHIAWEAELARVTEISSPMLQRRLAVIPAEVHAAAVAYKRHTYEGLLERARGEILWAQSGLRLVDVLNGGNPSAVDPSTVDPSTDQSSANQPAVDVSGRTP